MESRNVSRTSAVLSIDGSPVTRAVQRVRPLARNSSPARDWTNAGPSFSYDDVPPPTIKAPTPIEARNITRGLTLIPATIDRRKTTISNTFAGMISAVITATLEGRLGIQHPFLGAEYCRTRFGVRQLLSRSVATRGEPR